MKYYFLVAYLPEILFDDTKIRISLSELLEERYHIPETDWKEIELVLLGRDILILDMLLSGKTIAVEHSLFEIDFWREQIKFPKEGPEFILKYLKSIDLQSFGPRQIDELYAAYFDHVVATSGNKFLREYFIFQKNLRNILTAIRAREKFLEPADHLVGDGELVEILGTSSAEDFGLGDRYPWLEGLIQAVGPHQRQEATEKILWDYLDENAGPDPFHFNSILVYMLKTEFLQKRLAMSEEKGMETVRRLGGL